MNGEELRRMNNDELKALPSVCRQLRESETKLNRYREILLSEYGIVSVEFERMVWQSASTD